MPQNANIKARMWPVEGWVFQSWSDQLAGVFSVSVLSGNLRFVAWV